MLKIKRIYISGPMTEIEDFNHPTFHTAAYAWRALGWDVHNPANVFSGDTSRSRTEYMKEAVKALLTCDAIVMLPGWENSKGAKLELAIALELGLDVHYEQDALRLAGTSLELLVVRNENLGDDCCSDCCDDCVADESATGATEANTPTDRETILTEAQRIVYSERAVSYGNPENSFAVIAALWDAYMKHIGGYDRRMLSASDVALMMVLLKVGRSMTGQYKRDNAVDGAGYFECWSRIHELQGGGK